MSDGFNTHSIFLLKWTQWRNKENISDFCLELRDFDPHHMGATFIKTSIQSLPPKSKYMPVCTLTYY